MLLICYYFVRPTWNTVKLLPAASLTLLSTGTQCFACFLLWGEHQAHSRFHVRVGSTITASYITSGSWKSEYWHHHVSTVQLFRRNWDVVKRIPNTRVKQLALILETSWVWRSSLKIGSCVGGAGPNTGASEQWGPQVYRTVRAPHV